jgi:hypothetical protein
MFETNKFIASNIDSDGWGACNDFLIKFRTFEGLIAELFACSIKLLMFFTDSIKFSVSFSIFDWSGLNVEDQLGEVDSSLPHKYPPKAQIKIQT